jgi:hypothetical protein
MVRVRREGGHLADTDLLDQVPRVVSMHELSVRRCGSGFGVEQGFMRAREPELPDWP